MDRDNTTSADTDIPCKRKTLPVEETAIKKQKASHHQELTIPSPTNSQQEEVDILSVSQQEESVDTPADSQQEKSADTPADSQQEESVDTSTDSHQQEVDTHTDIIVVQSEKSTTVSPVAIIDKHPSPKEEITEVISQNTPHLSSPVHTPPTDYGEVSTPPQKTYISKTDKMRMEYERTTLTKVRKALDIVITDRLACNRPALYHQIESVLCNSTQRTITLTHICQIMFLAPNLYTLEAKELRNYGGKVTEAHLIKFAPEWKVPLSGKNLHEREVILDTALINYFQDKVMPTIPAIPIPTLATINKDQWCEEAKLPSGVKGLLTALKKKKELAAAQEAPKVEHKGTVEDRMAALRARVCIH
ncbi:hypothetical protein BDB01DRAFT_597404 [Pilobolus umbonatus]|nr:hypothetical protein BDB01DRAFT_597404 [Pilobolus umbonatus]